MNTFSLEQLLSAAAKRMRLDLAERLVPHKGELGSGREAIIRSFLQSYLPKRFEVSTGFLFDSRGRVSDQLDIVIANTLAAPRFETSGDKRFFPCEAVVAVGQVKSTVTSRAEFTKALKNLESAKLLDRSAGGKALDLDSRETLKPGTNHLDQLFTFLFITGKALAQATAQRLMLDYILSTAPTLWPNVILAVDRYLGTFCCDDGVCPNPMDARGVAFQADDGVLLMHFYLLLGRAVEVTRVSSIPYWEYLHGATQWSADVWYHASTYPPPLLASITTAK